MSVLGKFIKQPNEILDYDVDYTDWFANRSDAPASIAVVVEAGITLVGSSLTGKIAKVALSGGTDGNTYTITVRLTTSSGMVKEADFQVKVKESA